MVWYSYGSSGTDSSFASVQGQRFDAAGTEVGGEFQVNTYTTNFHGNPSVGVDPDGDFVVVWRRSYSSGTYIDSSGIQGQRFDAAGTAVGTEFQVNTYATNIQVFPSVAADAYGNFMVVWQSPGFGGTDTSDTSIQGQRFATPIFADGFEGGDVSAWSSTVP